MDTPIDEYHGQGGTYVMDPITGKRTLVERTMEASPAEAPAAVVIPGADPIDVLPEPAPEAPAVAETGGKTRR